MLTLNSVFVPKKTYCWCYEHVLLCPRTTTTFNLMVDLNQEEFPFSIILTLTIEGKALPRGERK